MIKKAIFLDRDGVLISNKDHYYIWESEQLNLIDGVINNLQKLAGAGFMLFIVSNQSGIAKGLYTKHDVDELHAGLLQAFLSKGITVSEIAYCPHHPDVEKCICRKPSPLLIDKLIDKYKIDRSKSYMIGDKETDVEAARMAGISGIKIAPNENMFPYISFLIP